MLFSHIYGNEIVKKALISMVDSGRVPHAVLFHENEGCGALAIIQAFLQYLNCKSRYKGDSCDNCRCCNQISKFIYPDIHYVFPITSGTKVSGKVSDLTSDDYSKFWKELALKNPYFLENELTLALGIEKKSGLISTAESRSILNKLSVSTFSDGYRAIVIWLPEKMNQSAANSLLKAIEEPFEKTIFLLVTHNPQDVMQTIASRCLRIRIHPNTKEEICEALVKEFDILSEDAAGAANFAMGSIGQALYVLSNSQMNTQFQDIFADLMDRILSRDFEEVLRISEDLANLDSREKQKAFCVYAGDCLRKLFMYLGGMENISGVPPENVEFYKNLSVRCKMGFCKKAIIYLDRAIMLIDRNVNQKILFCNLLSRLFVSV